MVEWIRPSEYEGTLFQCVQQIDDTVLNHMLRRACIDAPGVLHHIVNRGIEGEAIFKDDTDREDFIERLSGMLQEMDADAIDRYQSARGHRRCVPFS